MPGPIERRVSTKESVSVDLHNLTTRQIVLMNQGTPPEQIQRLQEISYEAAKIRGLSPMPSNRDQDPYKKLEDDFVQALLLGNPDQIITFLPSVLLKGCSSIRITRKGESFHVFPDLGNEGAATTPLLIIKMSHDYDSATHNQNGK